jgi:tetraacyldisaccharide 4'-kinase
MRDPAFWWTEHSAAAALLAPLGACYGAIATRNMARPGCRAPAPVICVGNFTLGGAGKTPTAIALARLLLELGRRPFFLSRGYGGRVAGPVLVDNSPVLAGENGRVGVIGARSSRADSLPPSKSAVADFDHSIDGPKPAYTRFRLGGGSGWGVAPWGIGVPTGSTPTPDPSPAEPRYSEGSATQENDRSRQQPTSVGGGEEFAASSSFDLARMGVGAGRDVGDEPLLLARVAPTVVARDRPAGVKAAVEGGADTIIMDDGLQNPSVDKDLAIAVVDGRRGIGNGRIFPAGPLRAPLEAQFDHIDAVLLVGSAGRAAERAIDAAQRRGVPVFRGDLHPEPDVVAALAGKPVLAFAGIGDPDKFFATLEAHGIPAAIRKPFPDHHRYTVDEMSALVDRADRNGLTLVTTEKDLARLSRNPAAARLIERSSVVPVTLRFSGVAAVEAMLRDVIRRRGPIAA